MVNKITDKYRPFKAVIFDADGVVINTEPLYEQGDREFFSKHGVTDEPEKYRHLLTGKPLDQGIKVMQKLYGFGGKTAELADGRLAVIKKYYREVAFVPGFLDFFAGIKNRYKTAIATSSVLELFRIADGQLHLTDLFGGHVYFLKDVNNVSKPAPDIFLHAARQLGEAPENCLVIEDAVNGVMAAKNAGMKCIALTTTHDAALLKDADQIAKSYAEINLDKFSMQ